MVYLMRHGQDDESYVGGWSDVSLIPEGEQQVIESAEWIRDNLNIKKIYCSDVNRAMETAKIVSKIIGVNYEDTHILREQNKGILNGMLRTEADKVLPGYKKRDVDYRYPEGESLKMLYGRVKKVLDTFEFEDDVLFITHRGVINMIYYISNDIELDMNKKRFGVEPASIHEYDYRNKKIRRIK